MEATKGSYVTVTGSTDGIGKDLALEFARKGYGVQMIARNQQKLDDVKREASEINPNKEHLTKKIDFSKASIEQF